MDLVFFLALIDFKEAFIKAKLERSYDQTTTIYMSSQSLQVDCTLYDRFG